MNLGVVITPSMSLRTIYMEDSGPPSSRLLGYNQAGFAVHAGYEL
jgi:hypothetical protein